MTSSLKAIMDDSAYENSSRCWSSVRQEDLIKWSRMKFKAKKSRSRTIASEKQKEVRYTIAGENIPTVKEEPVKSLGRWC